MKGFCFDVVATLNATGAWNGAWCSSRIWSEQIKKEGPLQIQEVVAGMLGQAELQETTPIPRHVLHVRLCTRT